MRRPWKVSLWIDEVKQPVRHSSSEAAARRRFPQLGKLYLVPMNGGLGVRAEYYTHNPYIRTKLAIILEQRCDVEESTNGALRWTTSK